MVHTLFFMMLIISSGIYAGEQSRVSRQRYRSQSGKLCKRGKKRSQIKMPTLEQCARNKFPGPDVQLGQKIYRTSSERRKRAKAWQEIVLLEETSRAGSAEQCAAVTVLLKAKVHPDMKFLKECGISFQGSPLCNAAAAGNVELSKALLKAGADVNASCWFSSKRGYGKNVPILAAARAGKEQADYEGYYPEVIILLHEYGANINVGGETQEFPFAPIHMVALQRLQRGEDVDSSIARQTAILKALIACGAHLEKKTFNGDTAIELATKRGNAHIAYFLEKVLESQGKGGFGKAVIAYEEKSSKGLNRLVKSAKGVKKSRNLKGHLKKQCRLASSSEYSNEY